MFEEAKNTNLTNIQKEIIFGSLLGDMGCYKRKGYINWTLGVTHSIKQKEYFLWKFDKLKPLFNKYRTYNRNNTSEISMDSITHKELSIFGENFYKDKKKVVPKNMEDLFTPLSLATWIMDDGTLNIINSGGYEIASCSFTKDDNYYLIDILKSKFNILAKLREYTLNKNSKKYHLIKLSMEESRKLSDIIKPFVVTSMQYKTF